MNWIEGYLFSYFQQVCTQLQKIITNIWAKIKVIIITKTKFIKKQNRASKNKINAIFVPASKYLRKSTLLRICQSRYFDEPVKGPERRHLRITGNSQRLIFLSRQGTTTQLKLPLASGPFSSPDLGRIAAAARKIRIWFGTPLITRAGFMKAPAVPARRLRHRRREIRHNIEEITGAFRRNWPDPMSACVRAWGACVN